MPAPTPTPLRRRPVLRCAARLLTVACVGAGLLGCSNVRATREPFAVNGSTPAQRGFLNRMLDGYDAFFGGISRLGDQLYGDQPAVSAREMVDESGPPEVRRAAISRLVRNDFAQQPPYTEAYATIAASDADPLVRATAIRAIHRSAAGDQRPALIERLEDQAAPVRLEAAKALGSLPDPDAAAPLLRLALDADENLDVRLAAVEALRHYEDAALVSGLGQLVEGREFSLAWQARRSLIDIVGQDHGYDARAYLAAMTN